MQILRRLKEIISQIGKTSKLDNSFSFPYSIDKATRAQQLWDNLQKGIFFEDKQVLIPWLTPYNQLENFKEKRDDSGDRTNWYLGRRKVLDGYEGHFEVMKWIFIPWTNGFERVSEFLGFGKDGHIKFLNLVSHLTATFGEATNIEIEEENENFTEGSYEWKHGHVIIRVSGFDMHGSRYKLIIGLIQNKNKT